MKQHVFRLHKGDDLLKSIAGYCEEHSIEAGFVSCCVGCVDQAEIRSADGRTVHTLQERLEIVSLTGTVSRSRCHLHIALAREDLSVIGGHLCAGCLVNTTAEVALGQLDDLRFSKVFDPSTGYNELLIENCTDTLP